MALFHIVKEGNRAGLQRFIECNGREALYNTNNQGQNCIHVAVDCSNHTILRFLLDNYSDIIHPNTADRAGWTALHSACSNGDLQIIHTLLTHYPDLKPHPTTIDHTTPLHYLVRRGISSSDSVSSKHLYFNLLAELINRMGDINSKNTNRETALHCAGVRGELEVVEFLLNKGADVNIQNNSGETIMHILVRTFAGEEESKKQVIKTMTMILEAGGDYTVQGKFGDVRKLSEQEEFYEIVNLIRCWKEVKIRKVEKMIKVCKEQGGKRLNLGGLGLNNEEIPSSLWELQTLEELDLSRNRLSEVDQRIQKLKWLKELGLDYNCLKCLPQAIGSLRLNLLTLAGNLELPGAVLQQYRSKSLHQFLRWVCGNEECGEYSEGISLDEFELNEECEEFGEDQGWILEDTEVEELVIGTHEDQARDQTQEEEKKLLSSQDTIMKWVQKEMGRTQLADVSSGSSGSDNSNNDNNKHKSAIIPSRLTGSLKWFRSGSFVFPLHSDKNLGTSKGSLICT